MIGWSLCWKGSANAVDTSTRLSSHLTAVANAPELMVVTRKGSPLNRVQSAAYCKAVACKHTFSCWNAEWSVATLAHLYPSFVHKYTVVDPLNRDNHPLWREAVHMFTDPETGKALPVYSHHTTTTALHLATSHAFTLIP